MKNTKKVLGITSIIAVIGLIILSLTGCPEPDDGSNKNGKDGGGGGGTTIPTPDVITITNIVGVTLPATGQTPEATIDTAQYTGTVEWNPAVSGTFAPNTTYTATITLIPKSGFTLQGVTENFTVAGVNATYNADLGVFTVVFPATGETAVPDKYEISLSDKEAHVFSSTEIHVFSSEDVGYTAAPEALTVTVTNTGNKLTGTLTVALSGTNADSFTLSSNSIDSIAVSGSGTFTIAPNTGLDMATYTATVTVSGDNGITAGFNVSFKVNSTNPTYSIGLSQTDAYIFDPAIVGYSAQAAHTVTITNTGNRATGELNIGLTGANPTSFSLLKMSITDIAVDDEVTFTIAPTTGLAANTYAAIVTVSGGNNITSKTFTVSFTVKPKAVTPAASLTAGTYDKAKSVTLTTTTAGAKIYYTTNGTTPTVSSTLYSNAIIIGATTTLKAIAVKDDMGDSDVLTAEYTFEIGMVKIDAGDFTMGSPTTEANRNANETQHSVTLAKSFYMGKYQVTQAQYQAVMGNNPSAFNGNPANGEIQENRPVEKVSWYDALVFCNKLSIKEGLNPVYSIRGSTDPAVWGTVPTSSNADWDAVVMDISKNGYRMPTEAEWEYACRAGTTTAYNTGDTITANDAWFNTNSGDKSHEVGLKTPNVWGLYDIHGNMWEWCWDWYNATYYSSSPAVNPVGAPSGTSRTGRGGAWNDATVQLRSARRYDYNDLDPFTRTRNNVGIRLVRSVGVDSSLSAVVTPIASVAAGKYDKVKSVVLTTTTPGATIYYTLDGTTPPTSSTLYTVPINIGATTTLKAVAIKEGMNDSAILTAAYTFEIGMVSIPAGTFTMGSPTTEAGRGTNETQHSVFVSAFKMGKYEVTQAQYQAVMGDNPSGFNGSTGKEPADGEIQGNRPVEQVRWYNAIAFCNKLSMKEGLDSVYSINGSTNPSVWGDIPTSNNATWNTAVMDKSKNGYRLPTEAEWEYACRAGTTTTFNNGVNDPADTSVGDVAWYGNATNAATGNSASKTHEVGLKTPNAWGLYDMHGNVFEWCWDWFDTNYYTNSPAANPLGASSGTVRVLRGGSFDRFPGNDLRSARRGTGFDPGNGASAFGFRVARSVGSLPSVPAAATPTVNITAGTYNTAQIVTLTTTTTEAKIYYTLDGTNPPTSSMLYTDPINIMATTTLKAVAVKNGMNDSAILTVAYTISTIPVEMVQISGGTFTMGSPNSEPSREAHEGPQHRVTLSGFSMSKYQVTQAQYQSVMGNNPSYFHGGTGREPVNGEVQLNRPVEQVIWYDALVFCNKLSIAEGLTPAYSINGSTDPAVWGAVPTTNNAIWNAAAIVAGSTGYRLPTEAQWEYACRAGTTTAYNTGDTISDNTGWYTVNSGDKSHQAGLKPANAWGLYDMHGNTWDWCWDWYNVSYYTSEAQTNPLGPESGNNRLVRGGGWNTTNIRSRSAYRNSITPITRLNNVGFRLVRPNTTAPNVPTAATPAASTAAGTYFTAQSVNLTTTTTDAKIYYTLDGTIPPISGTLYTGSPISISSTTTLKAVAVKDGMNDSAMFTATYTIVTESTPYIITGSETSFTATRGGLTVGTASQPIQDVINAVRTDANGNNRFIQFGDSANTLDVGATPVSFNNTGGTWGAVTLTGKITGNGTTTTTGTIHIDNPVSVTSTADIANTASSGKAIYNNSTGAITISGGTISTTTGVAITNNSTGAIMISGATTVSATSGNAIGNNSTGAITISGGTISTTSGYTVNNYSTGAITISGGTVSSTTSSAVNNNSTGRITVSGTAKVTSANTNSNSGATIYLYGSSYSDNTNLRLEITGGTVENTAGNSSSRAIYNGSTGKINITNGTVQATGNGGYAIYNYSSGALDISGGTVSATTGVAVYNASGTITVSGTTAKVTSASYEGALRNNTGTVNISGGTIENTYNGNITGISSGALRNNTGTVNISGGTVQSIGPIYALYNYGSTGAVNISGGTVSAVNSIAVYNDNAGTITVSGTTTKVTSANTNAAEGTIRLGNTYTNSADRLIIQGGTIENTSTTTGNAIRNDTAGGVTMSGGTVSVTGTSARAIHNNSTGALTISNGTVTAPVNATAYAIYNNSTGVVVTSPPATITGTQKLTP